MKRFIQSNWPYLFLIAALTAVFSPVFMGKYLCFPAPDFSAYSFPTRIAKLNELLSGTTGIAIQDLFEMLLPPYVFCNAVYPVEAFLTALAFGWFLRGRGAGRAESAFGGLCFALMGYSLTLFSAGHRGFFGMTLYSALVFALLSRAIDGGRPLHWALAACSAAWALRFQPDFGAVFMILAAIYAACLVVRRWRAEADRGRFARRLGLGLLAGIAAFAVVGSPIVYNTVTKTLGERISQIERETPSAGAEQEPADGAAASASAGESASEKWIFTTNWSLPPDETLEFIAPAVKGRQSGDPASPYWGRLGRSWQWEKTHQGFVNFRQHIVYLGAIPLALALLAVMALVAGGSELKFEIRFWAAVWVVGLLLAFGRYTPFYRLFYSLPYISYLRAPVKFVRLVEMATAALAAIGATVLLSGDAPRRLLRRFGAICAGLAALVALFTCAVAASPSFFFWSPLAALGADSSTVAAMKGGAVAALAHGIVGFGLVAAAAFLRAGERPVPGAAALAALAAAVAIDVAIVARPFAFVQDYEYKYTDRNVITSIAAEAMRPGAPIVALLSRDQTLQKVLRDNISFHAGNAHPRMNFDHSRFVEAGGTDFIFKMIDVTGCGFVAIDADQAALLPRGLFTPVAGLARRAPPLLVERTANPGKDGLVLARVNNPRPYAQLFAKWSSSTEEALLGDVARQLRGFGMEETLPVVDCRETPKEADAAAGAMSAKVAAVQGIGGARRTVVEVESPCDAMLLVHRGHNKGNCALVDGVQVPQYKAGYSETAVFVPAGRHVVEISNAPRRTGLAIVSMLAALAFAVGLGRAAALG